MDKKLLKLKKEYEEWNDLYSQLLVLLIQIQKKYEQTQNEQDQQLLDSWKKEKAAYDDLLASDYYNELKLDASKYDEANKQEEENDIIVEKYNNLQELLTNDTVDLQEKFTKLQAVKELIEQESKDQEGVLFEENGIKKTILTKYAFMYSNLVEQTSKVMNELINQQADEAVEQLVNEINITINDSSLSKNTKKSLLTSYSLRAKNFFEKTVLYKDCISEETNNLYFDKINAAIEELNNSVNGKYKKFIRLEQETDEEYIERFKHFYPQFAKSNNYDLQSELAKSEDGMLSPEEMNYGYHSKYNFEGLELNDNEQDNEADEIGLDGSLEAFFGEDDFFEDKEKQKKFNHIIKDTNLPIRFDVLELNNDELLMDNNEFRKSNGINKDNYDVTDKSNNDLFDETNIDINELDEEYNPYGYLDDDDEKVGFFTRIKNKIKSLFSRKKTKYYDEYEEYVGLYDDDMYENYDEYEGYDDNEEASIEKDNEDAIEVIDGDYEEYSDIEDIEDISKPKNRKGLKAKIIAIASVVAVGAIALTSAIFSFGGNKSETKTDPTSVKPSTSISIKNNVSDKEETISTKDTSSSVDQDTNYTVKTTSTYKSSNHTNEKTTNNKVLNTKVTVKEGSLIYTSAYNSYYNQNGQVPYYSYQSTNSVVGVTLIKDGNIATIVEVDNNNYEFINEGNILYLSKSEAESTINSLKQQGYTQFGVAVRNDYATSGVTGFYKVKSLNGGNIK